MMAKGDRDPEAEVLTVVRASGHGFKTELLGRTALARMLETISNAKLVGRTIVWTDDESISLAGATFAKIRLSPSGPLDDDGDTDDALLDVLDDADARGVDLILFLPVCSPLIEAGDIDGAITFLSRERYDSVVSAESLSGEVWTSRDSGPAERVRRQDGPMYRENGVMYLARVGGFRECGHRVFGRTGLYVMPGNRSLTLDTEPERVLAEALIERDLAGSENDLGPALSSISLVVLDFDGVMTDNRVWVDSTGREGVLCSRADGWGVGQLQKAGYDVLCLSSERDPVVAARCRKLKIPCLQGHLEKWQALQDYLAERSVPASAALYLGNDVNDLDCMAAVGFSVAVRDAHPDVLSVARYVTRTAGGHGAVREVAELLLGHKRPGGVP